MSNLFIEIGDYLTRTTGNPVEDSMLAELTIRAGDFIVTEVKDLQAKTTRNKIYISVYDLAGWFATNWWRLRWEPERENRQDWSLCHKIGAAGGGYLWPDLTFISDGDTVSIKSKPSPQSSEENLRFLNRTDISVSATDFESQVDSFLDNVTGRLSNIIGSDRLIELWREVKEERQNSELAQWRKMEALLGYDPGDAPDNLIRSLLDAEKNLGSYAVEELAADSRKGVLENIKYLQDTCNENAISLHLPSMNEIKKRFKSEIMPSPFAWKRAAQAAYIARDVWGIGSEKPVSTNNLSDIFSIPKQSLDDSPTQPIQINAGFRNGVQDAIAVILKSPYPTNRRFALMRLVGGHLTAPMNDRVLPALDVKTQRQKFQRAFAQEFLCPYSALKAFEAQLDLYDDDQVEEAAHHFDVSPRMIQSIWVNKGEAGSEGFAEELRC